jgi:hypothetical protein
VLFDEQVVLVKLLANVGPEATQDALGVGPVLLLPQVIVSPATGPDGIQPPGATGVLVTRGPPPEVHVVAVQLLPPVAALATHAGSAMGPVVTGVQAVVTLATTPTVQDAGDTAVGPVFTVLQVVVCAPTVPAVQAAAATGPLITTSAHVTEVYELPAVAAAGVQDATAVGPVVWVVQNLPEGQLAAAMSPSPSSYVICAVLCRFSVTVLFTWVVDLSMRDVLRVMAPAAWVAMRKICAVLVST